MYSYTLNFSFDVDYEDRQYIDMYASFSVTSNSEIKYKLSWDNAVTKTKSGTGTGTLTDTMNLPLYEGGGSDVVKNGIFRVFITENGVKTEKIYIYGGDIGFNATTSQALTGTNGRSYIYVGGSAQDFLTGANSDDTLFGGAGDDVLRGREGNDILRGGDGEDVMIGGTGDDTYYFSGSTDIAIEKAGEGIDTILVEKTGNQSPDGEWALFGDFTLPENVENGIGSFLILRGNSSDNVLTGMRTGYGYAGADRLDGQFMYGGTGDDTYVVDAIDDFVSEKNGSGKDLVESSITFDLSKKTTTEGDIENLTLTGTAKINGTGNDLNNVIRGNDADNILKGGKGNDTLIGYGGKNTLDGGLGDDKFYVGISNDIVIDAGGNDTLYTRITRDLDDYASAVIENVTIYGELNASARGTVGNNKLTGNDMKNTLYGEAGNDTLSGKGGNDKLMGGLGKDKLTGGTGQDIFYFNSKLGPDNVDTITDFSVADDTIYLSKKYFTAITGTGTLSSAQFVVNTSGKAEDAKDRIIYEKDTGELYYDSNGDASGGSTLFAIIGKNLDLTRADFFVY